MQNLTKKYAIICRICKKYVKKYANPFSMNMQNTDRSIFCIFCIYIYTPHSADATAQAWVVATLLHRPMAPPRRRGLSLGRTIVPSLFFSRSGGPPAARSSLLISGGRRASMISRSPIISHLESYHPVGMLLRFWTRVRGF
jgi:hypothetical protein